MHASTDKTPLPPDEDAFSASEEASEDFVGDHDEAPAIEPESIPVEPPTESELTRAEVETAKADDTDDIPACLRRCVQCGAPSDARGAVALRKVRGELNWLHPQCAEFRERHPGLCK
jgi:hypothetical protein